MESEQSSQDPPPVQQHGTNPDDNPGRDTIPDTSSEDIISTCRSVVTAVENMMKHQLTMSSAGRSSVNEMIESLGRLLHPRGAAETNLRVKSHVSDESDSGGEDFIASGAPGRSGSPVNVDSKPTDLNQAAFLEIVRNLDSRSVPKPEVYMASKRGQL